MKIILTGFFLFFLFNKSFAAVLPQDFFFEPTATSSPSQWTSPQSAYIQDGVFARSCWVKTQVFKTFNIPTSTFLASSSAIRGIEVRIIGKQSSLDCLFPASELDPNVSISWNNGIDYTATKIFNLFDTTATSTIIVGGSTDTWGRTWLVNDFANGKFQVKFYIDSAGIGTFEQLYDVVSASVYYSDPITLATSSIIIQYPKNKRSGIPIGLMLGLLFIPLALIIKK